MKTIDQIDIGILEERLNKAFPNAYFSVYPDYCEPYTEDKPVIVGDWNYAPRGMDSKLESLGFAIDWEDQVCACAECYNLIVTNPTHYGWLPSYWIGDGFIVCLDCLESYIDDYFEWLTNNPSNAMTDNIFDRYNPSEYGFELVQSGFENGFHPGQNDNPKIILAKLLEQNPSNQYIFVIDGKGQFDISFSVYQKITEEE